MARLIFIIVFIVVGITATYYFMRPKDEPDLGVISPAQVAIEQPDMVPKDLHKVGKGHRIGSFSFYNQDGSNITNKNIDGKVHVAEYFFTTCGTICPKMTKQMKRVNDVYFNHEDFVILSFTVNPDYDTVAIMKSYAEAHGVKGKNWHFLTGNKAKLYELARRSYFILKPAEAKNQGDAGSDFIHTNNFVLVDRLGRIRKYYDGTSADEVGQLIEDIDYLLKEELD